MWFRIKQFVTQEQTFYGAVLILIALTAYGLGQQSVVLQSEAEVHSAAIIFTDVAPQQLTETAVPVVASKNGTKYHRLDCPGANTIKESNKVWFDSTELARAAGYLPAGNCQGLQ